MLPATVTFIKYCPRFAEHKPLPLNCGSVFLSVASRLVKALESNLCRGHPRLVSNAGCIILLNYTALLIGISKVLRLQVVLK